MPTLFLLALLGLSPTDHALCDRVDLIEVNHYHDDEAKLVFTQIIFFDWCDYTLRFQVRDWRLLKQKAQYPQLDYATGEYVAEWHDEKTRGVLREVRAKMLRETWTWWDPELDERANLPPEQRRELTKP